MLLVKPNPRRMRYMRDSPAEGARGVRYRMRWDRVLVAACVVGAVAVGLIELVTHF